MEFTAQELINTLISAAQWMIAQPGIELRNWCKVNVNELMFRMLAARVPLFQKHFDDLDLVWEVICGGLRPVVELQRAFRHVEERFARREDFEWLIYGMRGQDSGAMDMLKRMTTLLLEWDPSWDRDKIRDRVKIGRAHV